MRFFHRFAPLSLCCALLLGMVGPAYAQEELLQGRVYRALDDSPYQVDFNREIDFDRIALRFGEDDFCWGDGDEDYDTFALLWDEAEFDAAVEQGETEFTMTGEYGLSEWSSAELAELWNAGLVTMPDPPRLLVQIRPRDYVTVYSIPDEEIVWHVHRSTTFEEAIRYQDTVALRPAEGANPYWDPLTEDFTVTWNREEYEAGIESGAESFTVSGAYGEPDWDAMKGWARAEGSALARVVVKRPPAQPMIYHDPLAGELGGLACAAYATPHTQLDKLLIPAEDTLLLVGGTYQDTRRFAVTWNREEFEAGMTSGEAAFTVSGCYAPHDLWPAEERQWWDDGLIRADTPAPTLTVHVIGETEFTFSADVRLNRYGDLGPCFSFPWIAGMEQVTLAYSLDNKTWYEEVWVWDDLQSDQRLSGWAELTLLAADEDYNPLITQNTAIVYVKMTVAGSALSGATRVYDLKPSEDGWDMTVHDDSGGDHGGGGQGAHDRPGRDEPDDPPKPPAPDPEQEDPSDPADASKPAFIWPGWPLLPETVPAPIPKPTPASAPGQAVPVDIPQGEQPAPADIPMQEEQGAPSPAGSERASTSTDTAQTVPAAEASPETAPSSPKATTGEAAPAPESSTAGSVPEPQPAPEAVPSVQTAYVPGFAAATAITAALVLCGAAWFRWRGKRK